MSLNPEKKHGAFWRLDAGVILGLAVHLLAAAFYLGQIRTTLHHNSERLMAHDRDIAELRAAAMKINAEGSEAFRHRDRELSLIYERVEDRISKLEDSLKDLASIRADLHWLRERARSGASEGTLQPKIKPNPPESTARIP